MKTKLTLQNLKVNSFVTSIEKNKINTVKGGTTAACVAATVASAIIIVSGYTNENSAHCPPYLPSQFPWETDNNCVCKQAADDKNKNGVQGYTVCCSYLIGCQETLSPNCAG